MDLIAKLNIEFNSKIDAKWLIMAKLLNKKGMFEPQCRIWATTTTHALNTDQRSCLRFGGYPALYMFELILNIPKVQRVHCYFRTNNRGKIVHPWATVSLSLPGPRSPMVSEMVGDHTAKTEALQLKLSTRWDQTPRGVSTSAEIIGLFPMVINKS